MIFGKDNAPNSPDAGKLSQPEKPRVNLTWIKCVDLQKCYPVKLGEALSWCYPASCSSGETLGGASLKWAKAQQSSRFLAPGST
jgi:hypothetical protein